jgi:hypothetical protein
MGYDIFFAATTIALVTVVATSLLGLRVGLRLEQPETARE